MSHNIIEIIDLKKEFKLKGKDKITALDNINFTIQKGEVFGLLGPNGAGKTTLISILTTLIQPTRGYALIDGIDIVKYPKLIKPKIALMLDFKLLYNRITAYANLKFICKMYRISNYKDKINQIVKDFGMEKWLNQYVSNFSMGMKMKLALCRTLLLERDILLLDEPTLSLDVQSKSFIIDKLKDSNSTIFLTSHDMSVVERLCDRIAFINHGNILKIGDKDSIKKLAQTEIILKLKILEKKNELKSDLNQLNYILNISEEPEGLVLSLKDRSYYRDLFLILSNYEILRFNEIEQSLEDLFIKFANQ
ncbi:MAG: ABC transporter ATP-binding protein [Candidatus Lokiarchaeota archaeon]|nr:ABC transporter ATP-binding protein [Candidatus Lokiarchaeota archaeon]